MRHMKVTPWRCIERECTIKIGRVLRIHGSSRYKWCNFFTKIVPINAIKEAMGLYTYMHTKNNTYNPVF